MYIIFIRNFKIKIFTSDGSYSPTDVIKAAKKNKLKAISLTVHDSIAGLKEAKIAAEDSNIELINGIEISALYKDGRLLHILGLGIDIHNEYFLNSYNKMKKAREKELTEERINEIKEELKRKDLKEEERKSLEEELKDGVNVKLEDTDKVNASYLRKAIKELNPKITDEKIDSYKESYKSFAWAVAVAPADDPEIAVVAMIPQGESSSNAMLLIREVLGSYFDLDNNKGEKNNKNDENTGTIEKENINFVSQMKK